tara:strand:- start:13383 stop:14261 length:879 start_codon:yes stop_codon:yes gene_type:complete
VSSSKLIIGGAQIGLNYGVSNTKGQLNTCEIESIVNIANSNDINFIDTASAYGNSEKVIGKYLKSDWKIITKLSDILSKNNKDTIFNNTKNSFFSSLQKLHRKNIYGLLLHSTDELKGSGGHEIWSALLELKNEGFVDKIGYSIYDPEELDDLYMDYEADIIQAPLSIFDQRLKDSGWLERLNKNAVEIHIRSIFLQGLLLMKPEDRPKNFLKWGKIWKEWDNWLVKNKITSIEACIYFALSQKNVDKIVVGINSSNELQEILNITARNKNKILFPQGCMDKNLINPINWEA